MLIWLINFYPQNKINNNNKKSPKWDIITFKLFLRENFLNTTKKIYLKIKYKFNSIWKNCPQMLLLKIHFQAQNSIPQWSIAECRSKKISQTSPWVIITQQFLFLFFIFYFWNRENNGMGMRWMDDDVPPTVGLAMYLTWIILIIRLSY